ncbi:MAG TPA: DUF2341 domain-containing protein, partial [Holophaga sp.]|nr:DUF2341 domain-containing protein [Holophaga sp.]
MGQGLGGHHELSFGIPAQDLLGGADLRFADSTGNELPYEIETWNTSGSSYIWVKVPMIVNATSFITAYWKNPGASAPVYTAGAVWDTAHTAVYHLNENVTDNALTMGAYQDATAMNNDADQYNMYKQDPAAVSRGAYSPSGDAGLNQRTIRIPGAILNTNAYT